MLTLIKKAAGGLKTTTATAIHNATDFIATKATREGTTGSFHAKPGTGIDRRLYRAVSRRDSIRLGAKDTTKLAGNLSDNEVFSRPEFKDGLSFQGIYSFGRDGLVRKAGRTTNFLSLTSRPPVVRKEAASGFQSQLGARTMTTVNTITTPKTGATSRINRQQAIENALTTALYFIRLPSTDSGLRAATGRAIRATAMLKQACAEISNGGGV